MSEQNTAPGLTINGMVDMSYGTAKANGFHDQDKTLVTADDAYGQTAAMGFLLLDWAPVVEAIRKPDKLDRPEAIRKFITRVEAMKVYSPEAIAHYLMQMERLEPWQMRTLAWLALMVTELVEAMEAVIKRDKTNFIEELADTVIRMGDSTGAINDDPAHPFNGLDLAAAIIAKNERNKARGYRHGGKRA